MSDKRAMTTAAAATGTVGILTAIVVLAQAGFIDKYQWTAPETGTPAVRYEVEAHWIAADTTATILKVNKTDYTMRVRGIDDQGRIGPWSVWSDTASAR